MVGSRFAFGASPTGREGDGAQKQRLPESLPIRRKWALGEEGIKETGANIVCFQVKAELRG